MDPVLANDGIANVLTWTARVLTEADLRRAWQGQPIVEVDRQTVVTPLAREHLRSCGAALTWRAAAKAKSGSSEWLVAVEGKDEKALAVLRSFSERGEQATVEGPGKETRSRWYRSLAESLGDGARGALVFCSDAAVCVCVAAKAAGVRPTIAISAAQTARVLLTLGCNFLAVETTGRTFFELRQIARIVCESGNPQAPPELASVLKEQDGRAHR